MGIGSVSSPLEMRDVSGMDESPEVEPSETGDGAHIFVPRGQEVSLEMPSFTIGAM